MNNEFINNELQEFIQDRISFLKKLFVNKSLIWINKNIKYDYYNRENILKEKDFNTMIIGLNNLKKFGEKEISLFCNFIDYSYTPIPIIRGLLPDITIPSMNKEDGLVKYYIKYNPKSNSIFVTFRGTKTFWEIINGLKFYRVPFDLINKEKHKFFEWRRNIINKKNFDQMRVPMFDDDDIEIHKGFLDEADLIYNNFIDTLSCIINPKRKVKIILTGHSLGGVLATIIGIYLAHFFQDEIKANNLEISLVNVNMPPVGNKNFNLLIPFLKIKNYVRIYNYQDFVPYYGYYGTWIETKKFRHLDFMLKTGISEADRAKGRSVFSVINKTRVWVKDYGKNLEIFLKKNVIFESEQELKLKYIYHDLFKISPRNKLLFI